MLRRVSLLVLLVALAMPVAAGAQQDPFGPLPAAPPSEPAPTTTSSTTTGDGGLKSWQEVLIILAGGIVIVGIGWAIVSDARRHAPTGETVEHQEARSRREVDLKRRKQKSRAAAKRSRAARKKNR
jgi:hypothetical protein